MGVGVRPENPCRAPLAVMAERKVSSVRQKLDDVVDLVLGQQRDPPLR